MHFIHNDDDIERVYDLRHDPVELSDLIPTPRGAEAEEKARRIIKKII
jgi:hypothetical protein